MEKTVKALDAYTSKLARKIRRLADFNACEKIIWEPSRYDRPGKLLAVKLKNLLKKRGHIRHPCLRYYRYFNSPRLNNIVG